MSTEASTCAGFFSRADERCTCARRADRGNDFCFHTHSCSRRAPQERFQCVIKVGAFVTNQDLHEIGLAARCRRGDEIGLSRRADRHGIAVRRNVGVAHDRIDLFRDLGQPAGAAVCARLKRLPRYGRATVIGRQLSRSARSAGDRVRFRVDRDAGSTPGAGRERRDMGGSISRAVRLLLDLRLRA